LAKWIWLSPYALVWRAQRYEFEGSGKELYQVVRKTQEVKPNGYVSVFVKEFLQDTEKYNQSSSWIEKDVES
jgi:hypothetical protein